MDRTIRVTVVFAFICGTTFIPLILLLNHLLKWDMSLKVVVWVYISSYGVLLAKWSYSPIRTFLFPMGLLLGAALWPQTYTGYFMLTMGIFCWIRSTIFFQKAPIRSLSGELITIMISGCILSLLGSDSITAWSLRIFLFFMIQSLYFFIVPIRSVQSASDTPKDRFERAYAEVVRLLRART